MLVTINLPPAASGHHCAAQQKHGAPRRAVRRAGRGRSHITNLEFSKDISATLSAAAQLCAAVGTGADDAAVQGLGHFLPLTRPGGLLRERQHPAVSHPHCQPDRPAGHLYRARTADGAPAIVYETLYREQNLRFEQSPAGLTVEGALTRRGLPAGGQRVQPVHQRAAVRRCRCWPGTAPCTLSPGGEPQLHRHDPRRTGRLRGHSRWLDAKTPADAGRGSSTTPAITPWRAITARRLSRRCWVRCAAG